MRQRTLRLVLTAIMLLACGVLHQQVALADGDAISIYSSGVDGILVDSRDRALRDALHLIDERILDLPGELDEEMPADVIGILLQMLMSPMNLRAGMIEEADPTEGPPFYVQLSVQGEDVGTVRGQADRILEAIAEEGPPMPMEDVPGRAGLKRLDLDGMPAYLGTDRLDGHPAVVAALSRMAPDPADLGTSLLPAGIEPALLIRMDGRRLADMVEMALAQAPPAQADMLRQQMELYGIGGEAPMTLELAVGHTADRTLGRMRYGNYAASELYASMIVREPLRNRDLRLIPADATYAEVWRADLSALPDMIRGMLEHFGQMPTGEPMPDLDEIMAQVQEMTGVHLERDLLDHLGTAGGSYMAPSTGGGGLLSLCAFVELKDPDKFGEGHEQLCEFISGMAAGPARGYVRIAARELEGRRITSLLFPGLPVPLEISWGIEGNHLFMAATPQGVIAAMGQATGRGKSILDNPRLAELAEGRLDEVMGFTFIDSPALIRDGYGLVSMAMSALFNAVRSPGDPDRGMGLHMPTYHRLQEGAQASLAAYWIDGDDLMMSAQSDRSMLAGASAVAGIFGGSSASIFLGAAAVGAVLPAMGKARGQAKLTHSMAQLRMVAVAAGTYAAENEDRVPPSLQALIDDGYLTPDMVVSPLGPVGDGGADIWFKSSLKRFSECKYPDRRILAYDRASYHGGNGSVTVLFVDGHIESLEIWDFHERAEEAIQDGVDFDVPEW